MVRIARVEAVDEPHHVIQRGNRRQKVFIRAGDQGEYLKILKLQCDLFSLEIWAYCLMGNHVHLIVVPRREGAMVEGIGETHRLYTRMINFREGWRGYLWQGRFRSFPLDENYVFAAVRYVERNPVRAGMVAKAEDYPWSSARAHVKKVKDPILTQCYLEEEIETWAAYLDEDEHDEDLKLFRMHGQTGRPLGKKEFIGQLETRLGRILEKQKPGPKK